MQRVDLSAEFRQKAGKGEARSLRRAGKTPGVLYGGGKSTSLTLDNLNLTRLIDSGKLDNTLVDLSIGDSGKSGKKLLVILRDVQRDPVTATLLHVDFFEVSLRKPIHVHVHVEVTGDVPQGVKDGGVLQKQTREVEVACLPTAIPERFEMDASQLKLGESIHVRDLPVESGIKVLTRGDQLIVSVVAPISEEELAPQLEEAAEPEVVGQDKKETEEGAVDQGSKESKDAPEGKSE